MYVRYDGSSGIPGDLASRQFTRNDRSSAHELREELKKMPRSLPPTPWKMEPPVAVGRSVGLVGGNIRVSLSLYTDRREERAMTGFFLLMNALF
jgi:hypothetical protein